MNLFDVYPLFDIAPIRGEGSYIFDAEGSRYLDLYGGHAVISIGHSHPHYVKALQEQVARLGFYSNSVQNPLQAQLAQTLGRLCGYPDYQLFLINSGAEAVENALKVASFHTGRSGIAFLGGAFHGRTSAAVAITDNPKIQAAVNPTGHTHRIGMNDLPALETALATEQLAAVVVEGIQGVGGIVVPDPDFLQAARALCTQYGTLLILDEIQAGYGRSGRFFAHQHAGVKADIITIAKGMGNGFPIGGVLISPEIEAWYGMLGTTFGGNHLACAAGQAVLDVIEQENLIEYADQLGTQWMGQLAQIPGVESVRGHGLMIGLELPGPAAPVRKRLLFEHQIFTGSSSQKNVLRLLPPLNVQAAQTEAFNAALAVLLQETMSNAS